MEPKKEIKVLKYYLRLLLQSDPTNFSVILHAVNKLEKLTKKPSRKPSMAWIKKKIIQAGDYGALQYFFTSFFPGNWEDIQEKVKYKNNITLCVKNAYKQNRFLDYINGCRHLKIAIDTAGILEKLSANDFAYFEKRDKKRRKCYDIQSVFTFFDYLRSYSPTEVVIPKELLQKMKTFHEASPSYDYDFWNYNRICVLLKVKPKVRLINQKYAYAKSSLNLKEMESLKELQGRKVSLEEFEETMIKLALKDYSSASKYIEQFLFD